MEEEKEYQVWSYGGRGDWHLNEFDTFTECVEFLKEGEIYNKVKITRKISSEHYSK